MGTRFGEASKKLDELLVGIAPNSVEQPFATHRSDISLCTWNWPAGDTFLYRFYDATSLTRSHDIRVKLPLRHRSSMSHPSLLANLAWHSYSYSRCTHTSTKLEYTKVLVRVRDLELA